MAGEKTLELSMLEQDIAAITVNTPRRSANLLSLDVLNELERLLDELDGQSGVAGLVIRSGKPHTFLAGADIGELAVSLDQSKADSKRKSDRGKAVFARLATAAYVTVAAIDGSCAGGGAELACWCDRRILSRGANTSVGFPEVKLGLVPGWGGTVRLPRMIGLANAVEMISSGSLVDANKALAMGLADDLVAIDDLSAAAIQMIREEIASKRYIRDRQEWSRPIHLPDDELDFLRKMAAADLQQKWHKDDHAPLAALNLLVEAAVLDAAEAGERESAVLASLFGTAANVGRVNVFMLTDQNKRALMADGASVHAVDKVGVVGAGIMGAGIAAANLRHEIAVAMLDASEDSLRRGVQEAIQQAAFDPTTKDTDHIRAVELSQRIVAATNDEELAGCDMVIEAIVENKVIKQRVLQRLEGRLAEHAVLASNTSTFPITELATGLARPDRFCGIHFFNPVNRMKVTEVIRGEQTADDTVAAVATYLKRIGKMPIVVNDGPGFLVNRILSQYLNESQDLICRGVSVERIDRTATDFGMAMGPLMIQDMVGLDTALFAGRNMWEAFSDRMTALPVLPALMRVGRNGRKSGKGFYSYENKHHRAEPDPEVARLFDPYIRPREFDDAELVDRLFLPMVLEASRAIEDGIAGNVRDIDLGMIFGLGFPAFRGGLMFWADTIGAAGILERLKRLEGSGGRFQPTDLLVELARDRRRFYDL